MNELVNGSAAFAFLRMLFKVPSRYYKKMLLKSSPLLMATKFLKPEIKIISMPCPFEIWVMGEDVLALSYLYL